MRRILLFWLLLPMAWLSRSPGASAQSADGGLETFFKGYLANYFRSQPLEATRLGDHRFDAELEDLSAENRGRWDELIRNALADLPKRIDYRALSRPGQIDFEILQHHLATERWLFENTKPFEEDPRVYSGYINDSVYLLLTQSTLPAETNIANCIARMAQIPRVVAAAKQNLRNPPPTHTETAIRQNQGAIDFYSRGVFELAGNTPELASLKAAAEPVVTCLKGYQTFLEQVILPKATGEWRLGREKFARKLELVLDAGRSADEVMADAETEFGRVEREMYVISRQLWSKCFPERTLPPDDAMGQHATVQLVLSAVAREHCRPEELTVEMKQCVAQLKSFIEAKNILRLPNPDHCQVIEMPEFKRGNSTAYMQAPPPLDPNATGQLAVSPPPKDWDAARVNSYLEEYNLKMLQVLAIHEGYPGHSVQLEYANQNPSLIRRVFGSGVYIEGWAVYTEQMMLDQGYGQGDLGLRLSQLKFYLRAVANAILDHKLHCSEMTDEEALRFLTDRCFQSEGEARLKIIRAHQSSCQLSTYFVGRMAHYRLRQKLQREWGDKFQLGRYHEAVLAPGAVPVKYLPELARASLGSP